MSQIASAGRFGVTVVVALVSVATVAGSLDQLSWAFESASSHGPSRPSFPSGARAA